MERGTRASGACALTIEQREESGARRAEQADDGGVGDGLGVEGVARQPFGDVLLLRGVEDELIEDGRG